MKLKDMADEYESMSRSPQGERGLKRVVRVELRCHQKVAPRKGSVG